MGGLQLSLKVGLNGCGSLLFLLEGLTVLSLHVQTWRFKTDMPLTTAATWVIDVGIVKEVQERVKHLEMLQQVPASQMPVAM